MTDKTRQELIYLALSELGKLEEGEVPSDTSYNTVDGYVDPLIEQLSADGIVYISDPDAIEPKYFLALGWLLANACAARFGGSPDEAQKAMHERTLRRLTSAKPSGEVLKAEYF